MPDRTAVEACYCGMCRRRGGGPAIGVACGTEVRIDAGDTLRVYRSSEWAERALRTTCGTHLDDRLLPTGDHFVPVGLLQDGPAFAFAEQIFIDR